MKSLIKQLLKEGLLDLDVAANLLLNYFDNMGYAKEERLTSSEKKSRMAKYNWAWKKLNNYLGFQIGNLPSHTPEQKDFIKQMYNRVDDLRKQREENLTENDENLSNEELKSKSARGKRYLEMLRTGLFQHYDSPKGELSPIGDDDDRKRLVSKLSKEDKKNYKEWLKNDDGKESLTHFSKTNEID
jgi:integrase